MLSVFQQPSNQPFMLMQTKWASELNPIIALPTNSPSILQNIALVSGTNVINHKLGRTPIGWIKIDDNAGVTLYRNAAFNDLTLSLNSSGAAVVSLMVF